MLYGHGDDSYLYNEEIVADFSTNVWYGGEPAGLKQYLFQNWNRITRYPEVMAESLAQKISDHHHLPSASILITNGTTESIYLIAQAFKTVKTSIAIPAFTEYEDACRMHDHQVEFLPWDALNTSIILRVKLFFICNPNNPTGMVLENLLEVVRANPETIFVVDEAFIEFTFVITSLIDLINEYDNLVVLRSLTKCFAIPGLRLGYIAANADLIEKLKLCKAPWSVNVMAIEAGHYIFDNYSTLQLPLHQLLLDKEDFISRLEVVGAMYVHRSHTHFFHSEIRCGTAKELKQYLVQQHRILIRDASNFRGLSEKHIRLATLVPDKNQLLIDALNEWKKSCC